MSMPLGGSAGERLFAALTAAADRAAEPAVRAPHKHPVLHPCLPFMHGPIRARMLPPHLQRAY